MLDAFFLAQTQGNDQQLQGAEPQTTTTVSPASPEGTEGDVAKNPPAGWEQMVLPLMLMVVVLFMFLRNPQKKEREARKKMLSSLKKNDKVRTIGGIIATVMEVREKEVILKIDESNNTRIKVVVEAIAEVMTEQSN